MQPEVIGIKYDKIAQWWNERHHDSNYGVAQIEKALSYISTGGNVLDVGCGAGGRFIRKFRDLELAVTGIDISEQMISLAKANHPDETFYVQDICTWETDNKYDFILAWDSIFHLPVNEHKPVLNKLSNLLSANGILTYTFGNSIGEETSVWHDDEFYYSSIGINENLVTLMKSGLTIIHLELDQYPERHVFTIAKKN